MAGPAPVAGHSHEADAGAIAELEAAVMTAYFAGIVTPPWMCVPGGHVFPASSGETCACGELLRAGRRVAL